MRYIALGIILGLLALAGTSFAYYYGGMGRFSGFSGYSYSNYGFGYPSFGYPSYSTSFYYPSSYRTGYYSNPFSSYYGGFGFYQPRSRFGFTYFSW